jgi:uncharacterized OsmC-like protein
VTRNRHDEATWPRASADEVLVHAPFELLGSNTASNPQELLMAALDACITVGYVAGAAAKGITLEKLEIETAGALDLRGFLGIDPSVRPGYEAIRYVVRIKGNGTPAQFQELFGAVTTGAQQAQVQKALAGIVQPVAYHPTLHCGMEEERQMAQYLLIESRDPFESNDVGYYYDLAKGLVEEGNQVTLFLAQNGVLSARPSAHSAALSALAQGGVTVLADDFSLRERGIANVVDGVAPAPIDVVVDHLAGGHKTLWH